MSKPEKIKIESEDYVLSMELEKINLETRILHIHEMGLTLYFSFKNTGDGS